MVEKDFEGVAYATELPPIAPDVVEDRLLHLGIWRLAPGRC